MNDKDKLLSPNNAPLPSPSIFFMNLSKNSSLSVQPLSTQFINSHTNRAPQLQQQHLPQYKMEQNINNFNDNLHYHSPPQAINNNIVKLKKPIIFQSSFHKNNIQSVNINQTHPNNQINENKNYFMPLNCSQLKDDSVENCFLINKNNDNLFSDTPSHSFATENNWINKNVYHNFNPKAEYRELKRKFKFLVYENECYQEELRNLQRKLLKLSRDKNFLLDRLIQYEKCSDSSDDSDSSVKTIDDKPTKGRVVKKLKTINTPRKKSSTLASNNIQNGKKSNNINLQNTMLTKTPQSKAKIEITNLSNETLLKSTNLFFNQQRNIVFSQNNGFNNLRKDEKYNCGDEESLAQSPLNDLSQRNYLSSPLNNTENNVTSNLLYNETVCNDFQQVHQFKFTEEDYINCAKDDEV